ncbi:MAG: ABC transporter ATP-binding protein [Desulfobulbaceae bacterium]|nr:MAG: ABC transporter ATP-binding protein [Desulfobulbaceae bacterium]
MTAIQVKNLSKAYHTKISSRRVLLRLLTGQEESLQGEEQSLALSELSFDVPTGQCLGIIGRNGSGKSTLLRILAGIVNPTSGTVAVNGRLSTVLDIQSGLNPRMSGRQNIYIKGALYGLGKAEINSRLDQIISFSGLSEYIDYPIHTYSTGMIIRLGFAIAMHMDFDILLMDEILSVGDMVFQRQCLSRIKQFLSEGKTIVLATHNLGDVSALCQRVLFLEQGRIRHDGMTESVLKEYWDICEKEQNKIPRALHPFNPENLYGTDTKDISITQVSIRGEAGAETTAFATGDAMEIRIGYHCRSPVENPLFRVQFFRNDGLFVHGTNTARAGLEVGRLESNGEVRLKYDTIHFLEGDYYLSIGIWPDEYSSTFTDIAYDCHQWSYVIQVTSKREDGGGIISNPCSWEVVEATNKNR